MTTSVDLPLPLSSIAIANNFWVNEQHPKNYGSAEFYQICDAEDYECFLRDVVAVARRLLVYSELMKFLKKNAVWQQSLYLKNIPAGSVTIEIHHFPLTMFDLADVFSRVILARQGLFAIPLIANEIMAAHYEPVPIIGLVPVTATEHQLGTNGPLMIHPLAVTQQVHLFYQRYFQYLPVRIIKKFKQFFDTNPQAVDANNRELLQVNKF